MMRHPITTIAATWCCLAGFLLPASAAIEVRFLAESLPKGLDKVVMVAEETTSDPFKLPSIHLSTPQSPPARQFQIHKAGDLSLLGTIRLPDEGKKFIVLLIPKPKGGFSSVVLSADQARFRGGDSYLYNHTNRPMVGYIGTARFSLAKGKGRTIRPKGAAKNGFYQVGFGVKEKANTRVLSMSRWPVDNALRSYVFFFKNPRTGRIDYRAADEFIPPPKKN
jgi:hypothetical protein